MSNSSFSLVFLTVVVIMAFTSCEEASPNHYIFPKELTVDFDDQYELEKVGSKILPLDSSIGFDNQSLVYYQEGTESKISIFNKKNASLHIFDYATGAQEAKIKFDYEGENGIGNVGNMGHFMNGTDSIFLVNHWEQRVYLLNAHAEILNRYELNTTDLPFDYSTMTSPSSPAYKLGTRLFITTQSAGSKMKDTKYLIELNLSDSSVKRHINGPEFMDQAFWGPYTTYTFAATINKEKSLLVTSMAKNPEVRVFDLKQPDQAVSSKVVGSAYVTDFTSFEKLDNTPPLYGHRYRKIASLTNMRALFTAIQYDGYRNLYYRTVLLPRNEDQYALGQSGMQESVIITDEAFNKVGETKLPRGEYKSGFSFINEEGLHLANLRKHGENENELVFDIYKPIKK